MYPSNYSFSATDLNDIAVVEKIKKYSKKEGYTFSALVLKALTKWDKENLPPAKSVTNG